MSKIARVEAALRGAPVDRPPISFWFHFELEEAVPSLVADLHVDLFRGFDLDWLKVMHDHPFGETFGVGTVDSPAELARLRPVAPNFGGFGRQLEVLRRIADAVGDDAWFVETIFSPWSIGRILTKGRITSWLPEEPVAVGAGLAAIAETLAGYVPMALGSGPDGIFYVVDGSAAGGLAYEEYAEPLDHQLLDLAVDASFNVLHVHGASGDLTRHRNPAVHALSAQVGLGTDALIAMRDQIGGALVSGLDERETLPHGTPGAVRNEVQRFVTRTGKGGLLVAPGCALRRGVREENLWAAREAVETLLLSES